MPLLPDKASRKLGLLIPKLASDSDGEVVSSVRAIQRLLEKEKKSWHDMAALVAGGATSSASNEWASMIPDIDWKAEMAALDASLPERLERVALMAERSDHWTDEHRLMPAEGVADILYEALDEIKLHRGIEE